MHALFCHRIWLTFAEVCITSPRCRAWDQRTTVSLYSLRNCSLTKSPCAKHNTWRKILNVKRRNLLESLPWCPWILSIRRPMAFSLVSATLNSIRNVPRYNGMPSIIPPCVRIPVKLWTRGKLIWNQSCEVVSSGKQEASSEAWEMDRRDRWSSTCKYSGNLVITRTLTLLYQVSR